MKITCQGCGVEMTIQNPTAGFEGACPKCHAAVRIAKGAKEYKFVTQKMLCGAHDSFDVAKAERVLNTFACEGWRVVSSALLAKWSIGFSDATYPTLLVLERDLP